MTWYAKPSGGYGLSNDYGKSNLFEIAAALSGYTMEAIAGVCGNIASESGINPWRWQSDRVNYSGGYGLFQFTPARGYIYLSGATPNLSTSGQTAGATPEDGARQVQAFRTNELGKWVSSCWRSYWSTSTYADLYAYRTEVLNRYGSGSGISMSQFAQIDDIRAATFVFLACFEGPAVPNLAGRVSNANEAYRILTGEEPPTPPTPPPEPPEPVTSDILPLLFKNKFRYFFNNF